MQIPLRTVVFALGLFMAASALAGNADALLDPYLRIHDALAGDRMDGVAADAARIEKEATALGEPGGEVAAAASALASAGDLTAARTAFGRLSGALIAWAERSNTGFGPGVSTMYCPMANKSWVQRGDAVKNPYYGAAMLTCGGKKASSN